MTVKLFLNLLLLHFMPLMETSQGLLSCNIIICMTARKLFRVTWLIINPKIFLHFFLFGVPKDTSNQWRSSGGTKNDSAPQESVGSQASARSSNVNPQSEHWKSILVESYSNIKCATFEKGVRKKEVKKSLFILKKRVLQFYSVLN